MCIVTRISTAKFQQVLPRWICAHTARASVGALIVKLLTAANTLSHTRGMATGSDTTIIHLMTSAYCVNSLAA